MNNRLCKLNIITAAVIVVVLFVSAALSINNFLCSDFNVYDNDVRMLVSKQKNKIDAGVYTEGNYPCIIFALDGKVLFNNTVFEYIKGDFVNVQEMLQTDKNFVLTYKGQLKESFVIQHQGKTNGFAVFLIPEKELIKYSALNKVIKIFLPLFIGIIISIFILIVRSVYLNNRILKPLNEISSSAKAIIAGNYDLEIRRTYENDIGENEVGDLTFSFELMRDELKEKQIREEALKKSQQELISSISHDLKTPISTIKAYSEGLRDGIAKNPQAQKDYVKIIISKTDLLISMINELLEYSNTQLKQLDINRSEVYFLEYFIPVMKEIKIYVEQNNIDFSYEIKMPNMLVNIDKKRITEVLYNLIENSLKYIGQENGCISITAERQENFVLIKVKDNGIGISADDIPYVFDKFYRAEKSRSSSIPGSGLGLSICKYIIDEHGGEIYCKSRHNEGCEIGFTIR